LRDPVMRCRPIPLRFTAQSGSHPAGESRVSAFICEPEKIYMSSTNENECRSLMLTFELLSLLLGSHYHPTTELQNGRKHIEFAKLVSLYMQNHYNAVCGMNG